MNSSLALNIKKILSVLLYIKKYTSSHKEGLQEVA